MYHVFLLTNYIIVYKEFIILLIVRIFAGMGCPDDELFPFIVSVNSIHSNMCSFRDVVTCIISLVCSLCPFDYIDLDIIAYHLDERNSIILCTHSHPLVMEALHSLQSMGWHKALLIESEGAITTPSFYRKSAATLTIQNLYSIA